MLTSRRMSTMSISLCDSWAGFDSSRLFEQPWRVAGSGDLHAQQVHLADHGGRGQRRLGEFPERGRDLPLEVRLAPLLVVEGVEDPEDGGGLAEGEPGDRPRLLIGQLPRATQRALHLARVFGLGLDTDQQTDRHALLFHYGSPGILPGMERL